MTPQHLKRIRRNKQRRPSEIARRVADRMSPEDYVAGIRVRYWQWIISRDYNVKVIET